jgi:hypothetical protein
MNRFIAYLRNFGGLRITLLVAVVVLLILVPAPGTRAVYSGWPLITTLLVPVLAPLVFMLLLLDTLMAWVFLTDAVEGMRRRWRNIVFINLIAAIVLLLRWLPYYAALRV